MSKDSGKRASLGLFVTVAFVLLAVALYFVGQKQQLFGTSFHISGNFADVGGLQVGNSVRLAGVNVGSVEAMTILSDKMVRVDLLIKEDARKFIKKNATASIGSESMMGNKVVLLVPGIEGAAEVADHDVVQTSIPVSVDDILKKMNHTGENVVAITDDLAHLTATIRSGRGTLGTVFMNKRFAEDMSLTLANFKDGSVGLKELVEASRKSWLLWGSGKSNADKKADEVEKAEKEKKVNAKISPKGSVSDVDAPLIK
jgi:phospholipid/cholesterol/gamma-HCH transport system substrate-binding protein